MDRPSIVGVIGRYVDLKRSGHEFVGFCPFHSEKSPSFFVNEDKSVFLCRGCLEGGDVITFIEKIKGLGFKDALQHLGVEDAPRRPRADQVLKTQAAVMVAWGEHISQRIGKKLRALGHEQRLLEEFTDKELAAWKLKSLRRQWHLLTTIDDDLFAPECLPAFYQQRTTIENLLAL